MTTTTTTLSTTETLPYSEQNIGQSRLKLLKKSNSTEELPLAINFRDLADADPSKIKPNQVYRSSEIFKLEVLSSYGIKSLLDMRKHNKGKERHPIYCALESEETTPFIESLKLNIFQFNFIKTSVGLAIVAKMPKKIWWELFKGKMSGVKACEIMCPAVANPNCMGFAQFYKIVMDKASDVMADCLRVFVDAKNYPIMMHCTHGKDRTGILSFILEAICSVSIDNIKRDYHVSEVNLKNAKAKYDLPIDELLLKDSVMSADGENMTQLMKHLEENYGSLMGYLQFIGLTQNEVESIQNNLMKS
eukprot:g1675.t1